MDVVIFGAGGLGREIYDTLLHMNSSGLAYNVLGFIDDVVEAGTIVNGLPVLGDSETLSGRCGQLGLILGIANPAVRKMLYTRYKNDLVFPNIIHPSAVVSSFAVLGEGVLIQAFCVVAANANIGHCTMMNAHSGVGHDAHIGDYCSIMSYCDVAGFSVLGESVFVGTGVKVIPFTSIAAESYLCAGAIVIKDVLVKSKLMGNPAKIIG